MSADNSPAQSVKPLVWSSLQNGETYDSWLRRDCGGVIALAPRARRADRHDMPDAEISLTCPYCRTEARYTDQGRRVRRFPW